jgi:hypothetical protein
MGIFVFNPQLARRDCDSTRVRNVTINPGGGVSGDGRQRMFMPRAGIEAAVTHGCGITESMGAEKNATYAWLGENHCT